MTPGEAQDILSTNALGPISVCRAVLPLLRTQGSGHIVQISTTGGVGAMPLLGLYNASKWALEGFSEALAAEVSGFGVRVTIAELGGFATDWAGSSMQFAAPEPAYDELRSSMFGTPTVPWPTATAGPEDDSAGEPPASVAAEALLAVVDRDDGPLRVLIGDDTPGHVAMALAARRDDYQRDTRFRWPHP